MKISRTRLVALICVTATLLFPISSLAEGNFAFLKSVKKCHDFINDNGFYYSQGVEIPLDRDGNKRVDCSSFLSWCLYDFTDGEFYASKDSNWFLGVAEAILNGKEPNMPEITSSWKVITNPENFAPGDIMCYRSHVHVYAGKTNTDEHLVYNAGSNEAIREEISIISDSYFRKAKYALRIP